MKSLIVFCLLFLFGSLLSLVLFTYQSYKQHTNQIQSDMTVLQEQVADNFISSSNDLKNAIELPELNQVINSNSQTTRQLLASAFEKIITNNPAYTQLRYINNLGQEIVRVNQTSKGAFIVPQTELQNKADRYYFSDTMKLALGEYYISPLDLNIEGSKVVEPYEPTLRLATPVFDSANRKAGMVILNFDTRKVLTAIEKQDENNPTYRIYFTNSDGDWFRGPSEEDDWAFMFPDGESRRVRYQFPLLWSKILRADSGSYFGPEGYFYFSKIKPISLVQQNKSISETFSYFSRYLQVRDYYMVVIVHMPRELYGGLIMNKVIGINLFYILSAGGLLGFFGILLQKKFS